MKTPSPNRLRSFCSKSKDASPEPSAVREGRVYRPGMTVREVAGRTDCASLEGNAFAFCGPGRGTRRSTRRIQRFGACTHIPGRQEVLMPPSRRGEAPRHASREVV